LRLPGAWDGFELAIRAGFGTTDHGFRRSTPGGKAGHGAEQAPAEPNGDVTHVFSLTEAPAKCRTRFLGHAAQVGRQPSRRLRPPR
jgi:hypothetical protein